MGMTNVKNLIGNEVRAVGISPEGALFPIRVANNMRGVKLTGLIVSIRHRGWFKENEAVLRECFPNHGEGGQIIIFGNADSIAEVF